MIQFALYYFTFDMKIIKETLSAQNLLEYKLKLKRARRERLVVFVFLAVYTLFTIFLLIMKNMNEDNYGLELTMLVFRCLRFIIDMYMLTLFLFLLKFFI